MDSVRKNNQIKNFLHLLQDALECNKIPELDSPDWAQLFYLSKLHNVVSLGYESVKRMPVEDGPDQELRKRWKYENDQSTFQCIYQQAALEELKECFEREQIPVILLKGAVLREYYPREDLRTMSDLDILIRKEDIPRIRPLFSHMGYQAESVDKRNEDIYTRDECVTLEVHRELLWRQDAWNEYFQHVWERTEKLPGYNWVQIMNPKDFYFHLLGHMIQHMHNGGIGIKAFLDIKIFQKQNREKLETKEFHDTLKAFRMEKLNENIGKLFQSWEGEDQTDPLMEAWTEFIINCGAYGEVGNFIITNPAFSDFQESQRKSFRYRYIWRRLFPAYEEMKHIYPQVKKYTYFYYVGKRIYQNVIQRRKNIKREFDMIRKLELDKVEQLHRLYNDLGVPPVSPDNAENT